MSRIRIDIDGSVAEVRLCNSGKLNALDSVMLDQLEEIYAAVEADRDVRLILLTGDGDRAFCAGADIEEWSRLSPREFARDWLRRGHRVFDRMARISKPTIAAINGHALGGGLELAATCDIRIMSPIATLGLPETGIGIAPGWSGTQRLMRLLPESVVKEMALFNRRLSAEQALRLGFVAEISDDPLALGREIASKAINLSPAATEIAKYMIHAGSNEDRAALIEAIGGGMVSSTRDKAEGTEAFRQKRKPRFSGK